MPAEIAYDSISTEGSCSGMSSLVSADVASSRLSFGLNSTLQIEEYDEDSNVQYAVELSSLMLEQW